MSETKYPAADGTFIEASGGGHPLRREGGPSSRFIARVREYDANGEGGIILSRCRHNHRTVTESDACARKTAQEIAANRQPVRLPSREELLASISRDTGFPPDRITFA